MTQRPCSVGDTVMQETGFHDVRGIPICVGDLIRVKHFRHYRRREQMWLYFRVAEVNGRFVVYRWDHQDSHQCLLEHSGIGTAEVLSGESFRNERGELMMWNERKRLPRPRCGQCGKSVPSECRCVFEDSETGGK